jgi:small-conductance mechanosensitive channel
MLPRPYSTAVAVVIAFALAAIAARLVHALVDRALGALDIVSSENRAAVQARAKQLIGATTLLAYGVAAIVSISLAVARFGAGEPRWEPAMLAQWVLIHGINAAIVIVGAYVVIRSANLAIEHLQYKLGQRHAQGDLEWQRRAETLGGILTRLVTVSVGFVAMLMLLHELSIDVLPILTGAGIAGLAIGFGAQNLVRDVISGFFLILEDQVRVGDAARINGVGGTIEQISLRTIVLRDGDGAVQVFPNGTITSLANLSKQFAYANVDFRVAYNTNMDRLTQIVREVGTAMQGDQTWGPLILAPIEIMGIESLADGFATVRVRFKTLPFNQAKVASELRRRLMATFVAFGIRPFAG